MPAVVFQYVWVRSWGLFSTLADVTLATSCFRSWLAEMKSTRYKVRSRLIRQAPASTLDRQGPPNPLNKQQEIGDTWKRNIKQSNQHYMSIRAARIGTDTAGSGKDVCAIRFNGIYDSCRGQDWKHKSCWIPVNPSKGSVSSIHSPVDPFKWIPTRSSTSGGNPVQVHRRLTQTYEQHNFIWITSLSTGEIRSEAPQVSWQEFHIAFEVLT